MSIRVVVVDDSVVVRRLVVQVLESDPNFEVVGTAANGSIALTKVEQLAPDVVTMDIEMPQLNGVEAVRELRARGHKMPIIMFSTLTERGATATLDALSAGASDYVAKPANIGSVTESLQAVADQLIPKIKGLVAGKLVRTKLGAPVRSEQTDNVLRPGRSAAHSQSRVKVRTDQKRHAIRAVVLGSSTGGPEALSKLIGAMPTLLPVPLLITQHMPPVFTKQLATRLDRIGPHRVVEVTDGQAIVAGNIYIAPGDFHFTLTDVTGTVRARLTQDPPVNFCRPSVDVMFRSTLEVYGGSLLSVMLTGMGSDGKAGAGAIVELGGTVIVQDEQSSVVCGMPGAVATAGFAHRILPLSELGSTIMGLTRDQHVQGGETDVAISQETFRFVADLVHQRSAIALTAGKEYLVESRLAGLARDLGLSVDEYVQQKRANLTFLESEQIVEALTTNETSWFRDSQPFTALTQHILPATRAAREPLGTFKVWSAACSTGQEPYSIAMTLLDYFDSPVFVGPQPIVEILATDLSRQVLDRSMTGRYTQLEVNRGLPAMNLVRHFQRAGTEWEISGQIRSMVKFQRHNLLDLPPVGHGPFDVVFLRNVLIYFDVPTKLSVLNRIRSVMRPGGYLILGAAETTVGLDDSWKRVQVGRSSIYQKAWK